MGRKSISNNIRKVISVLIGFNYVEESDIYHLKYSSLSDYHDKHPNNSLLPKMINVQSIAAICTIWVLAILPLFQVIRDNNWFRTIYLFFLVCSAIYVFSIIIFLIKRLYGYTTWLKNRAKYIDELLEPIKQNNFESYMNIMDFILYGKTSELMTKHKELYIKLDPPRLWNNIVTTRFTILMSMLTLTSITFSILVVYVFP